MLREALAYFGEDFGTEFDRFLSENPIVPHTMFFTHLGSPETIRIVKGDRRADEDTNLAKQYWSRRKQGNGHNRGEMGTV
jgi:hypothetical protein